MDHIYLDSIKYNPDTKIVLFIRIRHANSGPKHMELSAEDVERLYQAIHQSTKGRQNNYPTSFPVRADLKIVSVS